MERRAARRRSWMSSPEEARTKVEAGRDYVGEGVYWNIFKGFIGLIPPLPLKGVTERTFVLNWEQVVDGSQAAIHEVRGPHCDSLPLALVFRRAAAEATTAWRTGGGLRRTSPRQIRPGATYWPASGRGAIKPPPGVVQRFLRRPKYPALTSLRHVAQRA
jgi:hypothetical protein